MDASAVCPCFSSQVWSGRCNRLFAARRVFQECIIVVSLSNMRVFGFLPGWFSGNRRTLRKLHIKCEPLPPPFFSHPEFAVRASPSVRGSPVPLQSWSELTVGRTSVFQMRKKVFRAHQRRGSDHGQCCERRHYGCGNEGASLRHALHPVVAHTHGMLCFVRCTGHLVIQSTSHTEQALIPPPSKPGQRPQEGADTAGRQVNSQTTQNPLFEVSFLPPLNNGFSP